MPCRAKSNWQNWKANPELPGLKVPSTQLPLVWRLNLCPLLGAETLSRVPLGIPAGHLLLQRLNPLSQASRNVSSRHGSGWSPVPRGVRGNEAP